MGVLNSLPFFHFCGIMLIVCLIFLGRKASKRGIIIISVWNFVGVLAHEMCHFLVGAALLGSPTGFSVIPKRNEKGHWVMGSVRFKNLNAWNSLPVGFAPLCLLALSFYLFRNWERWFPLTLKSILSLYLVVFCLSYNSLPSSQDLRVALNWRSLLLYAMIGVLILFSLNFKTISLSGVLLHRLMDLGF